MYVSPEIVPLVKESNSTTDHKVLSFGPKFHHSLLQLYLDGPKDKFFTFFDIREKEKDKKIKNSMIVEETKFLRSKNLKAVVNAQFKAVQSAFKAKNRSSCAPPAISDGLYLEKIIY